MSNRTPVRFALVFLIAVSVPASAFHRQTAEITAITLPGDSDLPRVTAQGRRAMALQQPDGLFSYLPFITGAERTQLASNGAEPAAAYDGRTFAWESNTDPAGTGFPGWQIVLERDGGTIVSGDCLQHWAESDAYFSFLGKTMMKLMGFIKPHNVGPGWLKQCKPPKAELRGILDLEFENVLPSHGAPVLGGARERYRPAVLRVS